ncbi:MAG: DUF2240 family protein [Candidatus Helarchaeota archaeon]
MSMSGADILKVVAIPFRIYNVKKLDIDKFIFTLSFHAFKNCNISTAKKILNLAIEQEKVKRENNSIIPSFDPWVPDIPLNWEPKFKGLENIAEIKLKPLPEIQPLEIIPISYEASEDTITEPFQHDMKLFEKEKLKRPKKEISTLIEVKKKEKSKKLKKKVKKAKKVKKLKKEDKKQKKLLEPKKKIKKTKKKKKTLMDFM